MSFVSVLVVQPYNVTETAKEILFRFISRIVIYKAFCFA